MRERKSLKHTFMCIYADFSLEVVTWSRATKGGVNVA